MFTAQARQFGSLEPVLTRLGSQPVSLTCCPGAVQQVCRGREVALAVGGRWPNGSQGSKVSSLCIPLLGLEKVNRGGSRHWMSTSKGGRACLSLKVRLQAIGKFLRRLWLEPFEFGLCGHVFEKDLRAGLYRLVEERFGIGRPALQDMPFTYKEVGVALLIGI